MYAGYGFLCALCVAALAGSGCLSALFSPPSEVPQTVQTTLPTTPVPTTANPASTIPVSQMALQLTDLPSGYLIRDRADISYLETDQTARNLGWKSGYKVTFYHLDQQYYDLTAITQNIDLYTPTTMNTVFSLREDEITGQDTGGSQLYQLPCPSMGDHTYAYSITDPSDPYSSTSYSILFTKKDVYEELNMTGTVTDYELLKSLARTASDRIQ